MNRETFRKVDYKRNEVMWNTGGMEICGLYHSGQNLLQTFHVLPHTHTIGQIITGTVIDRLHEE